MTAASETKNQWLRDHAGSLALFITLLGFVARLWAASGIFLNPDEALHFRLANQPSLALAYKASLTAAHPPLFILLLYFWRALGTSELWLRLPSVLAGTAFCWIFYKWLTKAAGSLAALIGLLFVALLPPIVIIGAEVRQYALLLAFLIGALYFLDEAFAKNSVTTIAAFALCLYLAMLFHYSAFLFAAALGIYAVLRIFMERPPAALAAAWAASQLGGLALVAFLYKTHLSKLGVGDSRSALQGWMSDMYLQRSYFDRAHDNPLKFLVGHSFGVFQYFFGQLVVGDVMGIVFLVGVFLLFRGKGFPSVGETQVGETQLLETQKDRISSRRLRLFLLLPFAVAGAVSLAHLYPYGGTRQISFLMIPAMAGVTVTVACLAAGKWYRGLAIATLILVACIAFGKLRQPRMNRSDQSRRNMAAAMEFVKQNIDPSAFIFTDYQTDLTLGNYLCEQRPISAEFTPANFEQFSCSGHRIVSTDYKSEWMFWADNFPQAWQRFLQTYNPKSGDTVWIFQAGWGVDLPADLQRHYAEFHDLHYESFGKNIKIFKMTVGQPMPAAAP
jgi:hypothetical protein